MRRVLLACLLVTTAFTGCLSQNTVENLRDDLEAKDEFVDRALLVEEVEFTPAGVADPNKSLDGPEDASQTWNETFEVPDRTRQVTVRFQIEFTQPDPTGPLPANPPDGEVRVYVEGPPGSGERRNITRSESATAGFDFSSPQGGQWEIGMEARGNGTVAFNVHGLVARNATT